MQTQMDKDLERKLRTAITYVLRTCVIGASNKAEDIIRTDKWSLFQKFRYAERGVYKKIALKTMSPTEEAVNTYFISGSFFTRYKSETIKNKNEKIGLCVLPSGSLPKDIPLKCIRCFVLIQDSPKGLPDALYFVDKSLPKVTLRRVLWRSQKETETLLALIYPGVTQHDYYNIPSLSKFALKIISLYTHQTEQQWYYQLEPLTSGDEEESLHHCLSQRTDEDLLKEDDELHLLLMTALYVQETRAGNCGLMACLMLKYLWENPEGIDTLEMVLLGTMDHCAILVNRDPNSLLSDASTWGPRCWIVDSWYGKNGLLYRSSEWDLYLSKVKAFCIHQYKLLQEFSLETKSLDELKPPFIREVQYHLDLKKTPYPSADLSPAYPIEFYYRLDSVFPDELRSEKGFAGVIDKLFLKHQKAFEGCLDEIETKISYKM